MDTKSLFRSITIAASILLLFVIYKVGGVVIALVYFAVVFILFLLYLMNQNPRLLLKLNLERFSRAISTKFDDFGGFFSGEGLYLKVPVGFREVNSWAGTELEIYCRPGVFSLAFSGKIVYPSERTVIRPGVVALNSSASALFLHKELSDNEILDILEELRKAARIVESGNRPYKSIKADGNLRLLAAALFVILAVACVFMVIRATH
jgi:hypothetical protein